MTTTAPEVPSISPRGSSSGNPLHRLTPEQLERIGEEFQAIHDEVYADLGERDATYIRSMIQLHRRLAAIARIELTASRYWPAWVLGTATLGMAKILENMEIGHNVLHGQWDWMNDPNIHSSVWDWDSVSPAGSWKHSHNFIHHTYTNIVGRDKDVGYEVMRVDPKQRWHPIYLLQPLLNLVLMATFEWGVAVHDLDFEAIRAGTKDKQQLRDELREIGVKVRRQVVKDYVVFPALSGRQWKKTLYANLVANVIRNVWSNAIIFCGHFPDQAYTFTEQEVENETRGGWYIRQLIGAVNIDGSPAFHVMSGNLSYQVEHHLFPDMPSSRYNEIAPRVRDICERYGLPYNTGPFLKQWLMVQRTILRLALPGGKERPKPGAYHRPIEQTVSDGNGPEPLLAAGLPAFP